MSMCVRRAYMDLLTPGMPIIKYVQLFVGQRIHVGSTQNPVYGIRPLGRIIAIYSENGKKHQMDSNSGKV